MSAFEVLDRLRTGEQLTAVEIRSAVEGASSGSWSDAQLGAFLMAVALRGLDDEQTSVLTSSMLDSGETWKLRERFPTVVDKHSTGGVGDKVSLILGPILAACGVPVVMLTGRALGHTGGTADKLESIPGLDLALDRERTEGLLDEVGLAIGIATTGIAPADRRLYLLRDATATISSLPLVVGSILSKKLATGAAGIAFDVKVGSGAFFPGIDDARELARRLVGTCERLGVRASALLTDMAQPLGRWVGHNSEINETVQCLRGEGDERLMEVTLSLCEEASRLVGADVAREHLEEAVASGAALEKLTDWARAQGARSTWLEAPDLPMGRFEKSVCASSTGALAKIDNQRVGWCLSEACRSGREIERSLALESVRQLGDSVTSGEELARVYGPDDESASRLASELEACFHVSSSGELPTLVVERVSSEDV